MTDKSGEGTVSKIGESEGWQTARGLSVLLDEVPSSFSTTIRTLIADHQRPNGQLSPASRFLVSRLLKGPTLKSPIYFATRAIMDEKIAGKPYIGSDDLIQLYSPYDLAAMIGFLYIYKKAKKLCDPDLWTPIAKTISDYQELGMLTGAKVQNMGIANGLIGSGMRHLALAPLLIHDRTGFNEYRRHLNKKGVNIDHEFEMNRWGTTSVLIGSVILQALGLGVQIASAFVAGLQPSTPLEAINDKKGFAMRLGSLWADSLLTRKAQPDITHDGRYYPTKPDLEVLVQRGHSVSEQSERVVWLDKGKDDISPQLTPQLFKDSGAGTEEAPAADSTAKDLEQVSAEVQEALKE